MHSRLGAKRPAAVGRPDRVDVALRFTLSRPRKGTSPEGPKVAFALVGLRLIAGALAGDLVTRVDLAVYEAFKTAKDGSWKAGVRNLGAAEGGVGYAVDEHNRGLITADMEKKAPAGAPTSWPARSR